MIASSSSTAPSRSPPNSKPTRHSDSTSGACESWPCSDPRSPPQRNYPRSLARYKRSREAGSPRARPTPIPPFRQSESTPIRLRGEASARTFPAQRQIDAVSSRRPDSSVGATLGSCSSTPSPPERDGPPLGSNHTGDASAVRAGDPSPAPTAALVRRANSRDPRRPSCLDTSISAQCR